MSSIPNIRTQKAIRGEEFKLDLAQTFEGTLRAWMKRDKNDDVYRSFDIIDNRYLFLSKDKTLDYYDKDTGEIAYPIEGKWYFDVEQILPSQPADSAKTIFKGTINFENDVTGSEGIEVDSHTPADLQSQIDGLKDNKLEKDGSIPLDVGYTPAEDQEIATKKYVDDNISSSVGVTYPTVKARVSTDHGNDTTGEIGNFSLPFKTITKAVEVCRAAIVATPALAGTLTIDVESGLYSTETDVVYAGNIYCQEGVIIDNIVFSVSDVNMSGLQQQNYNFSGFANITKANFDHADKTERHSLKVECSSLQFDSMEVASEFALTTNLLNVTTSADLYLVDSLNINTKRVLVGAGISTALFNINPDPNPGNLDNNSSVINVQELEVADTARLYLTNFIGTHEKHAISVNVDSASGCAIIARGRVTGDMTANFSYNVQFDNALSTEDHSLFETEDNAVINVTADITNLETTVKQNRGVRFGARGNSFINIDLRLVSYYAKRHVYIECFDNSSVTLNGTVDVNASGSDEGIYVYAPYEAPFDNVNNASNLYFQNVTLRQMNDTIGGLALWCWNGAHHMINIVGSYSLVGLWSSEKESRIDYNYLTIKPANAELTRELIVAGAAQSVFPSSYILRNERLIVSMNGFRLQPVEDYSLSPTELTLALPADIDDEILMESFDADPVIYEMTEWATTGPTSVGSVAIAPITFDTPVEDPAINAVLTGPDVAGDGVKYNSIPNAEDPTSYLEYKAVQDVDKILQLKSVKFSARVEDALDSPVIVKIQASNDNFASKWDSQEFEFSTASYVTKEWFVPARLFSPDKNSSSGIDIRILIYHNVAGTAQGILFNNFKLKGHHKS